MNEISAYQKVCEQAVRAAGAMLVECIGRVKVREKGPADLVTEADLASQEMVRRAILDEWAARGDVTLGELVAHVVVHEFAHHFGWSDDDIAAIDKWWE